MRAGIFDNGSPGASCLGAIETPGRSRGYTLIELAMVVLVVGLAALLVTPSFRDTGDLKSTSRRLTGMITFLSRESLARRQMLRLEINLDEGTAVAQGLDTDGNWQTLDAGRGGREKLPSGQRFRDVQTLRQGEVNSGSAYIFFTRQGRIDPAVVHLVSGDAVYTLAVNALTGRVAVRAGDSAGTEFEVPRRRGI